MTTRRLHLRLTATTGIACLTALVVPGMASAAPASRVSSQTDALWKGALPTSSTAATFETGLTVPSITCTTSAPDVFFGDEVYVADASSASLAAIVLSCSGTTPVYGMRADANGTFGPLVTVAAGDRIYLQLRAGSSVDTAETNDTTSGATSTASGAGFTPDHAFVGAQLAQATSTPLPRFGKVTFADVLADGVGFGKDKPTGSDIEGTGNTVEVALGGFTESGTTFAVTDKEKP